MRRNVVITLAMVALFIIAGCGGGGDNGSQNSNGVVPEDNTVNIIGTWKEVFSNSNGTTTSTITFYNDTMYVDNNFIPTYGYSYSCSGTARYTVSENSLTTQSYTQYCTNGISAPLPSVTTSWLITSNQLKITTSDGFTDVYTRLR